MREETTIELTRGYVVKVYADTCERLRLRNYSWQAQVHKRGYVYAVRSALSMVYLHRIIAKAKEGQQVDHINRDTLDCRDDNLRIATAGQNRANQGTRRTCGSGLKGVSWSPSSRKWMATITKKGIRYYLGVFAHKQRAAIAHDRAALALHGPFAGLNYPDRGTKPKMPTGGFPVGQ